MGKHGWTLIHRRIVLLRIVDALSDWLDRRNALAASFNLEGSEMESEEGDDDDDDDEEDDDDNDDDDDCDHFRRATPSLWQASVCPRCPRCSPVIPRARFFCTVS